MEDMTVRGRAQGQAPALFTLVQRLREQRLAQSSPEQRSKIELGEILSTTSATTKDPAASGD